jgi:hypothetical protein
MPVFSFQITPSRRLVCRDRESVREEEREHARRNLHERARHAMHGLPSTAALSCEPLPSPKWKWSDLFKRVFKIDVLQCPRCGGRCKILAVIFDPFVVTLFFTK